jgi:hypothetical protein
MSRIVSVVVENVVADRDVLEEAKKLLEKYRVTETSLGFAVSSLVYVTIENGIAKIHYDQDFPQSRELAARVSDAIIAASVAKSARMLGMNVHTRETEDGYEIEGWS